MRKRNSKTMRKRNSKTTFDIWIGYMIPFALFAFVIGAFIGDIIRIQKQRQAHRLEYKTNHVNK